MMPPVNARREAPCTDTSSLRGRPTAPVAICSVAVALIGAGPAHARGRYQTHLDQAQQLLQPSAANASRLSMASDEAERRPTASAPVRQARPGTSLRASGADLDGALP